MVKGLHRRVLILASQGVPCEVIALTTGVPFSAVELILRSPLAQAEVARMVSGLENGHDKTMAVASACS